LTKEKLKISRHTNTFLLSWLS